MKSTDNLDVFYHAPSRMAEACREAARTALVDPYWRESERKARHDMYMRQAREFERNEHC